MPLGFYLLTMLHLKVHLFLTLPGKNTTSFPISIPLLFPLHHNIIHSSSNSTSKLDSSLIVYSEYLFTIFKSK